MTIKTYGSSTSTYWKRVNGTNGFGRVNRYLGEVMWTSVPGAGNGRVSEAEMASQEMIHVQNDALTKFNGELQKAQYLASLIEAKSTASVIQVRALKALTLAKALTSRDVKAIKKYFQDVPKGPPNRIRNRRRFYNRDASFNKGRVPAAWLEFNFVYRPLAGDIKAFSEIMNEPFPYEMIKGTSKVLNTYPASQAEDRSLTNSWTNLCQIYGYARVKNANVNLIERLGMTDVIGTVWELIPWSWAIDYFGNVGDYLSNIDPAYNQFDWQMQGTTKLCQKSVWKRYRANPTSEWKDTLFNGIRTTRSPSVPAFTFQFTFDLNLRRTSYLMSAIALTLQGKFK